MVIQNKFITGIVFMALALLLAFAPALSTVAHAQTQTEMSQQEVKLALVQYIQQLLTLLKQLQAERFGGSADGFAVETGDATDVTDTTATLEGEVTLISVDSLMVWFELGSDEDDLSTATTEQTEDSDGTFSRNVAGLDPNVEYFFRAVASSSDEIAWGSVESFETNGLPEDTNGGKPDAVTYAATDVERGEARLNGYVDMDDFDNGVVFFVYGKDEDEIASIVDDYEEQNDIPDNPDDIDVVDADNELDSAQEYDEVTDGPRSDTEYFYTICVEFENDDGDEELACGNVVSFTTKP